MTTPRLFVLCLALPELLLAQGSLTPPGLPAPLFKTLDQVEPRIDLQNAPPSAVDTANADYHFVVNQAGSYYLSANLGVTKANGILIAVEGVTLDLNGFEVSRASGSGGNGIEVGAAAHRTAIHNGSLKGFNNGVGSNLARGSRFRDLSAGNCAVGLAAGLVAVLECCHAHDNTAIGILTSNGASLHNCTATGNATGIAPGNGSTLTNCVAYANTGTYGISAPLACTLINCSAFLNTGTGGTSAGIRGGAGSTLIGCTSRQNDNSSGATATTGMGFEVGDNSTIRNCTASSNKGDGIHIASGCFAVGNNCNNNGSPGDGAGILATGNGNRIEDNNVESNDRGIHVGAAGNFIIKNTARNNGASSAGNYVIVADNRYGQIVDLTALGTLAVSGKGPNSGTVNTTDPFTNFSY